MTLPCRICLLFIARAKHRLLSLALTLEPSDKPGERCLDQGLWCLPRYSVPYLR